MMIESLSGFSITAKTNFPAVNHSPQISATVMVIDERPLSRMTVVDLLAVDGYDVLESDGESVILDSVAEQQPDLVLLNVMLPESNGFEVCRQIKTDIRTKDIPVVLMTVGDRREHRLQVMESGADDFLVKPLDRLELSTRVRTLIQKKRLNEGLDQTRQVLFSIAKAVESRSSDRGASCARIADLVKEFGEYLHVGSEAIENLVFAAHLHDIGTIAIPDSVMLKEGELTPEETELVKEHVLIGEKICQPLRNRRGVLPIIRHHHERWDGSGYPDGLANTDIPFLAQVFQIIDIFDALTSDRPHKKAYSPHEALKIIVEETNKGWRNPNLVAKFTAFVHRLESHPE
ncbi:MAG: HD-GYP domain-containing protein [Xenococcus sp. (in: cyanobacteria)]